VRPFPSPVQERYSALERVGFRYRSSLSIFVQPDLKQVLTADFVETAHRDDLERAVRTRNPDWTVHSSRPMSPGAAAAILRAAAASGVLRRELRDKPEAPAAIRRRKTGVPA